MDENTIEMAIASITHNIECVKEVQQNAKEEEKEMYDKEITRLRNLLSKYKKQRK